MKVKNENGHWHRYRQGHEWTPEHEHRTQTWTRTWSWTRTLGRDNWTWALGIQCHNVMPTRISVSGASSVIKRPTDPSSIPWGSYILWPYTYSDSTPTYDTAHWSDTVRRRWIFCVMWAPLHHCLLKGQSNEISTSDFFTDGLLPSLLRGI